MLPRDERRFKAADLDSDQTATREEFTAFLHPEEFEHMKEIVVLVRYPKSLNWEAAPKPYPFLQSENVLQPKGNWTRTLQWNTLEGLCTQEMSREGSCYNKQPPIPAIQHNNRKLVLAYTESRTDGPHQWIFWAVLKCWQASRPFPSCPPPSCGFEVTLADPLYSSDRRREGLRRRHSMPLLFWPGNDTSFPFTFHGSYTDSLECVPRKSR